MDAEIQQFVRIKCRLTVPQLNSLINLINEWSRDCHDYDNGVIEHRVYRWVPGSVGVELDGGGDGFGSGGGIGGFGGGGFGGKNQQGLGGNDQQAVQGGAIEVSGSKEGETAVDEDHEAGHDHQSKRKRMREHQKEKK